jgi:hypothetical protein
MRASNLLRWLSPALVLVCSAPARAAPTRQQCVSAYEDVQVAMRRSRLLAAKAGLQTCLDEACPAMLRGDCAGWLKEVESRTPTVVVECVADGAPVRDARLFVDGAVREAGVDGKAMELDPGSHTFRVEAASGAQASADALLREGEKLKVVRIDLTPQHAKPPPGRDGVVVGPPPPSFDQQQRRPVPWSVYALGGLGLAAAAGFTTFAILGSAGKSDLEPCKPDCTQDQIDGVRQKFIVADVFLGVSVLSFLAAGYIYLTRPTVSVPTTTGMAGPRLVRPGAFAW